ncbi:MAG: hypothetical protein EXS31_12565 [Pedosphaera sp.]|nr:hypothetical protein [Pedosphaera sp.]
MMTAMKSNCSACGTELPPDAPRGLCPACVFALDESTVAGAPSNSEALGASSTFGTRCFGDYELIDEIARGGMGIVYKARQPSLDRIVAVKMILFGSMASAEQIRRFRIEASAAGSLQHPNIVAVHEVGLHENQHFMVMDYVDGPNLSRLVQDSPLPARKAATYLKAIAEAVQYAHDHGILHRDLKPSNVLLGSDDRPRVTDFGLAKRFDTESSLTLSGHVLGSPNYMPPEQAGGGRQKVGRTSDVYSLGAILYHLLTARPPFRAETIGETLQQVQQTDPLSPRLLNASIPRDLETICLKCLEKEPTKRYATATELADELGRFLKDEPILARPVTRVERAWRWCRRKPALAASFFLILILLLVVIIGAPIAVLRTNRARAEAERNLYAADMKLASEAVRNGALDHALALLKLHRPKPGAADVRGFEWRYLWQATDQREVTETLAGLPRVWNVGWVRLVRVGNTLYNLDESRSELRAWNMINWTLQPSRLPSHPAFDRWFWHLDQETALAVDNTNRTLTLYQLPGFQKGQVIPLRGLATQSAISPDRRLLAVCFQDGDRERVSVWDLRKNTESAVLGEYSSRVSQLQFSNDGKILAVPCADGVVGLWDTTTLKPLPGPPKLEAFKTYVQFAPSGSRFIYWNFASETGHLWDPVAGGATLPGEDLGGPYLFSPDGELLTASCSDGVRLFDMKSVHKVGTLFGHQAGVGAAAFSPDGRLLSTASLDRTARIWDLKTERELATLGGHAGAVYGVAFSTNGEQLVTINANGAAKVWDVPEVLGRNLLLRNSTHNWQLRMSADERLLASSGSDGMVHIWDRLNRTPTDSIQTGSPSPYFGLAFEPQGHRLAWASRTTLGILDLRSGRTNTFAIEGNQGDTMGIGFSPVNPEIIFSSRTNVMLCELPSMRLSPFARCEEEVLSIAYSPDGTLLAFGHHGGSVSLWDRKSGRKLFPPEGASPAHADLVPTVEFSRDGKWLASCGMLTINLWRVQRDELTLHKVLRGHAGFVPSVAFSPDGTRLVSGSSDSTLKLWNTAEGTELAACRT